MARLTGCAGVVLAGGASTRFDGGDKALATLDDSPLIRHVTDGLQPTVDGVVVNCRRAQQPAIAAAFDDARYDPAFAIDPIPNRGPVAGLRTALRRTSTEFAFATACDMPGVGSEFVDVLVDAVETDALAVVPRYGGRRQPLAAVYRTAPAIRACSRALDEGSGSLRDVLERLDPTTVSESRVRAVAPSGTFRNVNTRDDLQAAVGTRFP